MDSSGCRYDVISEYKDVFDFVHLYFLIPRLIKANVWRVKVSSSTALFLAPKKEVSTESSAGQMNSPTLLFLARKFHMGTRR